METIDLTKDQKLGIKIASRSMYGSFGTILPYVKYGHGWDSEKVGEFEQILTYLSQERLEYQKIRNKFFKETFTLP